MNRRLLSIALLGLAVWGGSEGAAQQQGTDTDLSAASLEDLTQMKLRVSSFGRKDQDLWVTPAAVFVITKEDIANSAATSIPELLRVVPGLQVAQIDASNWAVSARGFNSAYANKLLVLIDGRTMYSEIYSGAHWDQYDLPLNDIERIEVIRGPGAAVWGTNAVNGVINVITRRARSTQGLFAAGDLGRIGGMSHVQYGGSVGDRLQYRGYGYYVQRRPFVDAAGEKTFDGEKTIRGGGRVDWQQSKQDSFIFSGDLYGGHLKQQMRAEYKVAGLVDGQGPGSIAGGYLLGRWEHKLPHASTALQVYYDDASRHELSAYARTRTFDLEYQDHRAAGPRHDIVWGAELRFTGNHIQGDSRPTLLPEYKNYLVDGFIQDEISLNEHLKLTLGTKLQQGTLAGFQVQPSGRILWSPTENDSVWGAVSRAAVAPAIQDKALDIPLDFGVVNGIPVSGTLHGNPDIKPETVVAYEIGYRRRLRRDLTIDVASYFNITRRLQLALLQRPTFELLPTPHINEDLLYMNGATANSQGFEGSAAWKPSSRLSLQTSYSWLQSRLTSTIAGSGVLSDSWGTPRTTVSLSAEWRFAQGWHLNSFLSHVGALPQDLPFGHDPAQAVQVGQNTRLDLHVSHKLGRFTMLDAGGTNLLTPRHLEFGSSTTALIPSQVPRSLFVRAKWAF